MTSEVNPKLPISLQDLPLHQLIALVENKETLDSMSDAEIRDAIAFVQSKRVSPQTRRADKIKVAKELGGKAPKKDLLGDFM